MKDKASTMSNKPPAGHFRLLYFASAASFTAKAFDDFLAPLPVAHLFDTIEKKHPGITKNVLSTATITVNLDYVDVEGDELASKGDGGMIIQEADEVAIIPPVSSG